MHIALYFLVRHEETGAVGTEYRITRIQKIPIRVIRLSLQDNFRIMAAVVAMESEGQTPPPPRIGHQFCMIIPK